MHSLLLLFLLPFCSTFYRSVSSPIAPGTALLSWQCSLWQGNVASCVINDVAKFVEQGPISSSNHFQSSGGGWSSVASLDAALLLIVVVGLYKTKGDEFHRPPDHAIYPNPIKTRGVSSPLSNGTIRISSIMVRHKEKGDWYFVYCKTRDASVFFCALPNNLVGRSSRSNWCSFSILADDCFCCCLCWRG